MSELYKSELCIRKCFFYHRCGHTEEEMCHFPGCRGDHYPPPRQFRLPSTDHRRTGRVITLADDKYIHMKTEPYYTKYLWCSFCAPTSLNHKTLAPVGQLPLHVIEARRTEWAAYFALWESERQHDERREQRRQDWLADFHNYEEMEERLRAEMINQGEVPDVIPVYHDPTSEYCGLLRKPSEAALSQYRICGICTDSMETNVARRTPCGHNFCKNCILYWIKTQQAAGRVPDCPECRHAFDIMKMPSLDDPTYDEMRDDNGQPISIKIQTAGFVAFGLQLPQFPDNLPQPWETMPLAQRMAILTTSVEGAWTGRLFLAFNQVYMLERHFDMPMMIDLGHSAP